jgi:hypothetical protein
LSEITKRRSSKIPTLLANPCSFCISFDIVLHFVVSDFAIFFHFFFKRIIEKGSGDKRRKHKGSTPTSTRKNKFKEVRNGM